MGLAPAGGGTNCIRCIKIGTWDKTGTALFNGNEESNSGISKYGEMKINVDTLDNILSGELVTFIKMDIEGAELPSLKGAEKVISTSLPKLAICIYHSDTDMLEIPEYIMEEYPNYSLYVRHYKRYASETVLYAVNEKQRKITKGS